MAAKKKVVSKSAAPKPRGRSADAAEGAAKAKAKGKVRATGQTAESSMDAASRRYRAGYFDYGKDQYGRVSRITTLRDRVSGITRTTEEFPNNPAGSKSRSTYSATNAKTAKSALKNNVRYKDYMDKLSPVSVKKTKKGKK